MRPAVARRSGLGRRRHRHWCSGSGGGGAALGDATTVWRPASLPPASWWFGRSTNETSRAGCPSTEAAHRLTGTRRQLDLVADVGERPQPLPRCSAETAQPATGVEYTTEAAFEHLPEAYTGTLFSAATTATATAAAACGSIASAVTATAARGLSDTSARGLSDTSARGLSDTSARGLSDTSARGLSDTSARGLRDTSARGLSDTGRRSCIPTVSGTSTHTAATVTSALSRSLRGTGGAGGSPCVRSCDDNAAHKHGHGGAHKSERGDANLNVPAPEPLISAVVAAAAVTPPAPRRAHAHMHTRTRVSGFEVQSPRYTHSGASAREHRRRHHRPRDQRRN
jgi:hypothetical protein